MIDSSALTDDSATISSTASIGALAYIGPGAAIGESVTIGTGTRVLSTLDRPTVIKTGAVIGGGVTLGAGIEIGAHARIGNGVVVTDSVPANMILAAPRPRVLGYSEGADLPLAPRRFTADLKTDTPVKLGVGNCELWPVPVFSDIRGSLIALELASNLPFKAARIFLVYAVPSEEMRGSHAHRQCSQFLVAIHGSLSLVLDDGKSCIEVHLNRPNIGVHLTPLVWGAQYNYSPDAVLMVFASHAYDAADYIRNYDEFKDSLKNNLTP